MKSIIEPAVESPRLVKLAFLMVLDFCVFPVLLWLCYAIRQFDLGAEVVPNLAYGSVWVSVIAVLSLFIFGVYRFIVRTYSELFMVKLGLATSLTVVGLYALAYFTDAFIPTSIPLMFGFLMFAWVWFSRGFIRFIVRSYLQADVQKNVWRFMVQAMQDSKLQRHYTIQMNTYPCCLLMMIRHSVVSSWDV